MRHGANVGAETRAVALAAVMGCAAASAPAAAQSARTAVTFATALQTAPICGPAARPEVDSTPATVIISAGKAWNQHEFTDAERQQMLFHADAIRRRFVPPPSLGALVPIAETADAGWGGDASEHLAVTGKLVLVMRSTGRLREAYWQLLPTSVAFATAIHRAAMSADLAHEFEGIGSSVAGAADDTVVVQIRSTREPVASGELPLMRARIPRYITISPAQRTSDAPLFFPMYSRDGMVENDAEMYVLVGSDGKASIPESQVTRLELPMFLPLVRRTVAEAVYAPATSGGCTVPSVVIERFKLSLDR